MKTIVDIEWWRLALSGVIILVLLAFSRRQQLGLERNLAVGAVRGTVQLLAIGWALGAIFAIERWELVVGTLLFMLVIAAWTASNRLGRRLPGLRWFALAALTTGTSISLFFMTEIVIGVSPWYDPRHLIPLGGMLLGNAMNAASLGGERFQEEMRSRRDEIETRLALGFPGAESVHPSLARSLRAAMIPTINALMVAGLVQLPGMMTGQILSGVDPVVAVKYQILIFFALMLSTSTSTWMFLEMLRKQYVTPSHQFRRELTRGEPSRSPGGVGGAGSGRGRRGAAAPER